MTTTEPKVAQLDEKHVELIGKLVCDIRNGKLKGHLSIAQATVAVLEQIINECQNPTAHGLLAAVRGAGRQLSDGAPYALVATNMTRRVLRAIRDEQRTLANQSGEVAGESLQRLVLGAGGRRGTLPAHHDLREPLRDHIAELWSELEGSGAALAVGAARLLRAQLLLVAASSLTEALLLATRGDVPARVLIPQGVDPAQSESMAVRLAAAGVPVTLISNAAVFAVMCRVNKVVMGVEGALVGGAALGAAGSLALAQAARLYRVPLLALAPLCLLTPLPADPQQVPLAPPHNNNKYRDHSSEFTHVYSPQYDFIQPDHITLFITNLGGSAPSYNYRLLSELYDPLDNVL